MGLPYRNRGFRGVRATRFRPVAVLLVGLVGLVWGCSTLSKDSAGGPQPVAAESQSTPIYYDFGDVQIPPELKLNKDASFVYRSTGFTAGVLTFAGRVEMASLIRFFENNMAKDNWRMIGSFKSTQALLLFEKQNRWCAIRLIDNRYDTRVEVWLAPTTLGSAADLLK